MASKKDAKFEDDLVLALSTEPVVRSWLQQSAAAQPIIKPYVKKLVDLLLGFQNQVFKLTKERDTLQSKHDKQEETILALRKKNTQLQDKTADIGNELKRQRTQLAVLEEQSVRSDLSQLDEGAPVTKRAKVSRSELVKGKKQWADPSIRPAETIPDVGFQMPQRRKLKMEILPHSAAAVGGIRALTVDGNIDFGIDWTDVQEAFCLPVPERAKPAWNFVLIPRAEVGADENGYIPEPILWSIGEVSKKDLEAGKQAQPGHMIELLNAQLGKLGQPKEVICSQSDPFAQSVGPSLNPNGQVMQVRAFKGTMEGFLFFFETGLLFGFRKPLLFIPVSRVNSVSFTNIVKRTFDLSVTYIEPSRHQSESAEGDTLAFEEVEFSMIDQDDHPWIASYMETYGLNDESMAQKRKAKYLNINGSDDGKQAEPGDAAVDGLQVNMMDLDPQNDDTDSDDSDFVPAENSDEESDSDSSSDDDDSGGANDPNEDDDEDDEDDQDSGGGRE